MPGLSSLGRLVRELAPVREETAKVFDSKSIAGNSIEEFTIMSTSKHSALLITARASYDVNATAGVRIRWLYSQDGVSFDSSEDAEEAGNYADLTFAAGATRQGTTLIPLFTPYVKVQLVNKDTDHPVTVTVWRTMLR
ncbi:MAG: hypothetical protein QW660_05820 [Candidatus Bathyarchaeia archaeon]